MGEREIEACRDMQGLGERDIRERHRGKQRHAEAGRFRGGSFSFC